MIRKCLLFFLLVTTVACQQGTEDMKAIASQAIKEGKLVLKNGAGELKQGSNDLFVEFQDPSGNLLSIDDADMSAVMRVPGMPAMITPVNLSPTGVRGRFLGQAIFERSGGWKFVGEYRGASGAGSVSFDITVR